MRLVNVHCLVLEDFPQDRIPRYAILSHTWTDDEIGFANFASGRQSTNTGWLKIKRCCDQAKADGYDYIWADTCCIDKSSSAELSEAINSMYGWYQRSGACYAYLIDVPFDRAFDGDGLAFRSSRWFTRGWTLQELLAPRLVHFFSAEWKALGSRGDLSDLISRATGIGVEILTLIRSVRSTSIAQRMSWASRRKTTRIEDIAYSLIGIFDINMPMLYGEGEKAFQRLQDEILRISDDQSIFAWSSLEDENWYTGILARHPRNFAGSALFEPQSLLLGPSHSQSSRGIAVNVFLSSSPTGVLETSRVARPYYEAVLMCTENNQPNRFAMIYLVQIGTGLNFVRAQGPVLGRSRIHGTPQQVTILRKPYLITTERCEARYLQISFDLPGRMSVTAYTAADGERPMYIRRRDPELMERPSFADFGRVTIDGTAYLSSGIDSYKYWLPFMPLTEAVRLRIFKHGATATHVADIKLGTDASGQLGYSACLRGDALPRDYFQSEICQLGDGRSKDAYHHLKFEAPDLNGIKSGVACQVLLAYSQSKPGPAGPPPPEGSSSSENSKTLPQKRRRLGRNPTDDFAGRLERTASMSFRKLFKRSTA